MIIIDPDNKPMLSNRFHLSTIISVCIPYIKKYIKYTNHNQNNISNIFDHKALLTDISQCHFLDTIIEDIRSGMDVPAANIVSHTIA
jgi:hypothetical protein